MPFVVEALRKTHEREVFDCGSPELDEFIRRYARQNQARGAGRTFVVVREAEKRVLGFYTLSAGHVEFADAPEELRRKLPRYPIPVAHLGRLAVCRSAQGQGLGEALLFDALRRIALLAHEIGILAVEVWAKSEAARAFYTRYGFEALPDDPLHLYLPLETVARVLEQEG